METGHTDPGSALRAESPRREQHRRKSQFGGLFAGAMAGLVAGVLIQWVFGSERLTGHADDPFSLAFGLPVALAIAAGLFGLLLGTAREAAVVDAPVRVPGSPVPPKYDE